MKLKRKIFFFIALMSLFYCVSLMQETYAKYISSASANADLTVARWSILVNDQDIVENSNFTNTITPVFSGTTHIKEGVIAPTAEGYFDIELDGTDTDVSFDYTISVDQSDDNTVTDLKISRYIMDNVTYSYTSDITGTFLLNDQNKTKSIRFYVEWNDNAQTETMDNFDDSAATIDGVAALEVTVNVVQKASNNQNNNNNNNNEPEPDPNPEP